jgi:antitoxin HigA-1
MYWTLTFLIIIKGNKMLNPSHPGLSVRYDCIEPLNLTITSAAKTMGISRQALNNVVNGKSAITAEMALKFETFLGGSAELWLRLQAAYDLSIARKRLETEQRLIS